MTGIQRGFLLIVLIAGGAAGLMYATSSGEKTEEQLLEEARNALARGELDTADVAIRKIQEANPESVTALLLAGSSAAGRQNFKGALQQFDKIPDGTPDSVQARISSARILLAQLKLLTRTEDQLKRALEASPDFASCHLFLSDIYGLSARQWESVPHRMALIRLNKSDALLLYRLSRGINALENMEDAEEFHLSDPSDPSALVGVAAGYAVRGQTDKALDSLYQALEDHPDHMEAHARLGALLADRNDETAFKRWSTEMPESAEAHPRVWINRARWADRHGEQDVAIRCYWEAARRDGTSVAAMSQLGKLLAAAGRDDDAKPFIDRAGQIKEYQDLAYVAREGQDMLVAAQAAESLGLVWEALAWVRMEFRRQEFQRLPGASDVRAELSRLKDRVTGIGDGRLAAGSNPADQIDLTDFPEPGWVVDPDLEVATPDAVEPPELTFQDDSDTVRLEFQYFNGGDDFRDGMTQMYEALGGGVAVIDYDCDGWPDLHLTQGSTWPPDPSQADHTDKLFRNDGNGRFLEITALAGVDERGFSQGVAAGDFDNDGFPDLYVANIGGNQLFRNNGDGTFSRVTDEAGCGGAEWTSSCVIADLNGDTLPDIYAVSYLMADEIFTTRCPRTDGSLGMCGPRLFPAQQDQLYLNRGDGSFETVTDAAGIVASGGKGLGIVAADIGETGRLSLFIANDNVPNFFLNNTTAAPGDPPSFVEEGLISGLALNSVGDSEGCMGVAAGDVDDNGLLDFFVTNFFAETNTLYLQSSPGVFVDATIEAGLGEISYSVLGFGTQFLDADLDGRLDLVFVNGHIDDQHSSEIPYLMPPALFHNSGSGRFTFVPGFKVGPWFRDQYLGRGLARLDWNRDGREEFVASLLDRPAALLTNTTETVGRHLIVRLVGTASERAAIGATVVAQTGERSLSRQMTAGDGFFASNERSLVFGLGDAESVQELTVRWPSGASQQFENLPAGSEVVIVEGRDAPVVVSVDGIAVREDVPAEGG